MRQGCAPEQSRACRRGVTGRGEAMKLGIDASPRYRKEEMGKDPVYSSCVKDRSGWNFKWGKSVEVLKRVLGLEEMSAPWGGLVHSSTTEGEDQPTGCPSLTRSWETKHKSWPGLRGEAWSSENLGSGCCVQGSSGDRSLQDKRYSRKRLLVDPAGYKEHG